MITRDQDVRHVKAPPLPRSRVVRIVQQPVPEGVQSSAGLVAMLEGGNHADAEAFLAAEIAALAGQAANRFGGFFAHGFHPIMQARNHDPGIGSPQFFGEQGPGLLPASHIAKFIAGQPMAKALDNEAFPFPVEISLPIHRRFLFLSNLLGYRITSQWSTENRM